MIHPFLWGICGTLFLFSMTTLGAATVFFFRRSVPPRIEKSLLGFAAGVMTAASIWSLLLPAIEQSAAFGLPPWLAPAVGVLLGTVFLATLDALLPRLKRRQLLDAPREMDLLLPDKNDNRYVSHVPAVKIQF